MEDKGDVQKEYRRQRRMWVSDRDKGKGSKEEGERGEREESEGRSTDGSKRWE